MLILLVVIILILSYIRFFSLDNSNIEERPVNESSSNAIHTALKEITMNFNQNSKIVDYADNNIVLKASVNNYYIYISYITEVTVTYEFYYDDLNLNITIDDDKNNEEFGIIYQILIEAVQKRLNNEENVSNVANSFLVTGDSYEGLSKIEDEDKVTYKMNITKKIKNELEVE